MSCLGFFSKCGTLNTNVFESLHIKLSTTFMWKTDLKCSWITFLLHKILKSSEFESLSLNWRYHVELYVTREVYRTHKISESFLSFLSYIDWPNGSWFFNHYQGKQSQTLNVPFLNIVLQLKIKSLLHYYFIKVASAMS